MMRPWFHLSLDVRSVEESVEFFTSILGASVAHRDPAGYVNLDLYGTQITLAPSRALAPPNGLHFGLNFEMAEFNAIAERILSLGSADVVSPPRTVDSGTPLERKKMILRCPSGYRVELKGFPLRAS